MKIGFMHHLLGAADFADAFARASSIGCQGLEIMLGKEHAAALGSPMALELKKLSSDTGVALPSVCLGFVCTGPSLVEPAGRKDAAPLVRKAIDLAADAGAGVVLVPFFGESLIELQAEMDVAMEAIADMVEPAEQAGITLGIESTLNFNQQQFLVNNFAHTEVVKVYHDTGNALARKLDLPTGIRQLGPSAIAGIHYKDVKVSASAPPDFAVNLGGGNVDFRAVTQALRAINYDGWVMLESPAGADPLANAKANLESARQILR
jgi:sugar phosphate isomerase/epimerase